MKVLHIVSIGWHLYSVTVWFHTCFLPVEFVKFIEFYSYKPCGADVIWR